MPIPRVIPIVLSLVPFATLHAQAVTSPDEHLGRPLGMDFELADWSEVSGYFQRLAADSPRVLVETTGTTTEGRDFLLSIVSSEANLARLDDVKRAAAWIADPRGLDEEQKRRLIADSPVVLFVSIAMHSTETAAPQFGMEFAYQLATSNDEPYRSARDRMVVLIAPCLNPDGLDHVVTWYRDTVGTPYEGTGLLELYQRYAGHDNNRDWFMLSQKETQIVTRLLYSDWHPQVYWDVHQQGRSRERMFVPPFRDPLNPNLDPAIVAGIDAIGSRALLDMTAAGLSGISTGVTFDMWWNGGNRNVPVRHNIIGLLTEAASVNIASPVFLPRSDLSAPRGIDGGYVPSNRMPSPWPGGWWRLRDIIDYELAFGRSLLGSLSREPATWLQNALEAAERAIDDSTPTAPRAWVIPSDDRDRASVRRLVWTLLEGGVEIDVAEEAFVADDRSWPMGSIVIQRHQPYGAHVKDLFEVQRYPDGEPPYDVAGWTLPFLAGVRRVEVMRPFDARVRRVATADDAIAGFVRRESDDGGRDTNDSDTWLELFRRLSAGDHAVFHAEGERAGWVVPRAGDATEDEPPHATRLDAMPRVGLYAPWSGNMSEGWMRFVLDTYEVPYVRTRNEMLRAGRLGEFLDVLVLPGVTARQIDDGRADGSIPPGYARGLAPEGAVAIEEFVRGGGVLVAVDSSASFAIELLDLPIEDVTSGKKEFRCPGSVLRGVPETHRLTAGLPDSIALFFSDSAAFRATDAKNERVRSITTLLRYANSRTLLSGWIREPEAIGGAAAWMRVRYGDGVVHLFGFPPQYRSWSQGTFQLLFRALLLDHRTEPDGE